MFNVFEHASAIGEPPRLRTPLGGARREVSGTGGACQGAGSDRSPAQLGDLGLEPSPDPFDPNRPCMADAEDGEQPWDVAPFLFADPPDPADDELSPASTTGAEAA